MQEIIKEYLEKIPKNRKEGFESIRTLIVQILSEEQECFKYNMPTYHIDNEIFLALANQKSYISFYVMHHDLLESFQEELSTYNCGKSCIRLKKVTEKELELFKRIILHLKENHSKSTLFNKYRLD